MYVHVSACVYMRVCVCVRACVCLLAHACVCVGVGVWVRAHKNQLFSVYTALAY